jgi:predicted esterase
MSASDPHHGAPVLATGADPAVASLAMIMLHGRGASAADILGLAEVIDRPEVAYLAPEAAGHVWYPRTFTAPVETNEPWLTSALKLVATLLAGLAAKAILPERTILLGFSQGACLALTFAARNPMRYGGVIGLSGALIGAEIRPEDYAGSLGGTPVFLGCSDVDPHIPIDRVRRSAAVMRQLGSDVNERTYPGFGHAINEDEIGAIRSVIDSLTSG